MLGRRLDASVVGRLHPSDNCSGIHLSVQAQIFYLEEIRVFQAGLCTEYISME